MLKKVLCAFALGAVAVGFSNVYARGSDISVTINGTAVQFADQAPVVVDGRTLVPVRDVFEALNFDVDWNEAHRRITLTRGSDRVVLHVDSDMFTTNDTIRNLEVPAQVIGGRTMLPIRDVLESVGYSVGWDEVARTVQVMGEGLQMLRISEALFSLQSQSPQPPVQALSVTGVPSITVNGRAYCRNGFMQAFGDGIPFYINGNLYPRINSWITAQQVFDRYAGFVFTSQINDTNTAGQRARVLSIVSNTGSPHVVETAMWPAQAGQNPNNPHPRAIATESQFADAQFRQFLQAQANQGYIFWTEPVLLNSNQLLAMAEMAMAQTYTRSTIQLPNRTLSSAEKDVWVNEFKALGGVNATEILVIKDMNELRAFYGVAPVMFCAVAAMSSRFHMQQNSQNNLGLGHRLGPYGGAGPTHRVLQEHIGMNFPWYGTASNATSGNTPNVFSWENSPGHRTGLLTLTHAFGVGSGWGQYLVHTFYAPFGLVHEQVGLPPATVPGTN